MPGRRAHVPIVKIASGGVATVFVGVRTGSRELVALKRPHPHVLEDERQRREVLREAQVAAGIHHPNVAAVRGIEEDGEEVQLVLEYVEGASLAGLLVAAGKTDARIPPALAARIVHDATLGLAAVHATKGPKGELQGLVHRDVSPQNILVGVDGRARLTDFGLAKAIYAGAPSTTQGTLKGKLGYMAPEYVKGGDVTPAIDVFAMGVVLWEALAGRRLFRGENEARTLDRILRDDAAPLADVALELAPFDPVVARATAKDPGRRFASAEELARAIAAISSLASEDEVGAYVRASVGEDISARRAAVSRALRKRLVPWISVGGALAAVGIALAVVHAGQGQAPVQSTEPTPTPAPEPAPVPAPEPAPAPAQEAAPPAEPVPVRAAHPTRAAPHPAPSTGLPPNPYARRTLKTL